MLTSEVAATPARTRRRARDLLALAVKAAITVACFWYIFHQIQVDRVIGSALALQPGWVIVATLAVWLQILLVALRWSAIVNALAGSGREISPVTATAITMAGAFFGQVLPYAAGDAARAWLLVQRGRDWRTSVLSVLIDRAVGVGMLCALSFAIFLLPAAAPSLGVHRSPALLAVGAMLALGVTGLVAPPRLAPRLELWRFTRWIAAVALAAHHAVIGSGKTAFILGISLVVHALSMLAIWALANAQQLSLPPIDIGIIFIMMIAVAIFPFSIGGWGVREVAVISFLSTRGVPVETAFFFSVCFGFVLILATLPGAVVWFFIRPVGARDSGRG